MRFLLAPVLLAFIALLISGAPDSRPTRSADRISKPERREVLCGVMGSPGSPKIRLQDPNQTSELAEHTDHDCHWNEREPQEYYWYWGRNGTAIIDTTNPADTPPAGDPPPIVPPGATSGSELEIRKWRTARLLNLATAEDSTQGTGLQQTSAMLRWIPSPTWRNDVACCHANSGATDWSDTLACTLSPGLANATDYPKNGRASFGSATEPCATQALFYSSGCPPLGIPELMSGRRVEFDMWVRLTQENADFPPILTAGGTSQQYGYTYPPDTDTNWDTIGPPTDFGPTLAEEEEFDEVGETSFDFVRERIVTLSLSDASVHKSTTVLSWNNWIPQQISQASNCRVQTRAEFTPSREVLYDNGVLNHFICP